MLGYLTITLTPTNSYPYNNYQRIDDINNTPPLMGTAQSDNRSFTQQLVDIQRIDNENGGADLLPKVDHSQLTKHDSSSASLGLRKFVRYIKMTKAIDLSNVTYSKVGGQNIATNWNWRSKILSYWQFDEAHSQT